MTARFMSEDTYTGKPEDPLSLNLYTYCHNDPLMYSDPTGHVPDKDRDDKDETEKDEIKENDSTNYVVQDGDSLWKIAKDHRTTIDIIAKANNISDPYKTIIYAGDNLVIPSLSKGTLSTTVISNDFADFRKTESSATQVNLPGTEEIIFAADIQSPTYDSQGKGEADNNTGAKILNVAQTGLDVAGLVPGIGELADGTNSLIYLARGDNTNAALSGAACIPFVGSVATGGKLANKGAMALEEIVKAKPDQLHHFATNISKTYTPKIKEITDKYGLDLDKAWNKEYLQHQGRHPNEYHDYILENLKQFDSIAKGNKDKFLELYNQIKQEVISSPEMLIKQFWK